MMKYITSVCLHPVNQNTQTQGPEAVPHVMHGGIIIPIYYSYASFLTLNAIVMSIKEVIFK